MNKYRICRWDPVTLGDGLVPMPMIYFKPDSTLLQFAKENKDVLLVVISGSNSIYDGKKIPAILSKSKDIPNQKPNYFDKTNSYVLVLNSIWNGFPSQISLGEFTVYGLSATVNSHITEIPGLDTETSLYTPENGYTDHGETLVTDSMDQNQLIGVVVGFVGIFVVLFIVKKNSRSK